MDHHQRRPREIRLVGLDWRPIGRSLRPLNSRAGGGAPNRSWFGHTIGPTGADSQDNRRHLRTVCEAQSRVRLFVLHFGRSRSLCFLRAAGTKLADSGRLHASPRQPSRRWFDGSVLLLPRRLLLAEIQFGLEGVAGGRAPSIMRPLRKPPVCLPSAGAAAPTRQAGLS